MFGVNNPVSASSSPTKSLSSSLKVAVNSSIVQSASTRPELDVVFRVRLAVGSLRVADRFELLKLLRERGPAAEARHARLRRTLMKSTVL